VSCTRICTLFVIALAAVVVPVSVSSADLLVRGDSGTGSDARYDRFANSSDFIGAGLDFSGVGQDTSSHWATMISLHFFLSARHYHPGSGETVTLYDTNSQSGASNTYSVLGGTQIYSAGELTDVYVGILGSAVSEAYYPILDQNSVSTRQSIFVYGKPNKVGTNVINDIGSFPLEDSDGNTISEQIGYDFLYQQNGNADDAQLITGDSGGPSFVSLGGQLALVGTHSGNSITGDYPHVSFDTSPSFYIDEIDAAMASLAATHGIGAGEQVTVVPEPSSLILLGIAAVGLVGCCWRRGRGIM